MWLLQYHIIIIIIIWLIFAIAEHELAVLFVAAPVQIAFETAHCFISLQSLLEIEQFHQDLRPSQLEVEILESQIRKADQLLGVDDTWCRFYW